MPWTHFANLPVTLAQTDDVRPDVQAPTPPANNGAANGDGETQPGQTGDNGGGLAGDGTGGGGGLGSMWLIFLLVLVVMWIFLIGGQRKEKKKRAALLDALSKGDRVQTVGGILGTVVEVRDDEVVVKVDENTNARMRFSRSAIQTIVNDKDAAEDADVKAK